MGGSCGGVGVGAWVLVLLCAAEERALVPAGADFLVVVVGVTRDLAAAAADGCAGGSCTCGGGGIGAAAFGRARGVVVFRCTVRASGTSPSSSSPSSRSSTTARAGGKLGSGSPSASASPSPSGRLSPLLLPSSWASSSSAAVRAGERCGVCVDVEAAGAVPAQA